MKITDVMEKEYIIPDLKSEDKRGVLEEMVDHVASKVEGLDRETVLEVLLEREKLGSTGIGHGVAIPHGKLKDLDHLIVAFGRSLKGVDFQSLDDKPAHLFFLILAPENSTTAHLKILARISRLLNDPSFRKRLLECKGREEIYQTIREEDERH